MVIPYLAPASYYRPGAECPGTPARPNRCALGDGTKLTVPIEGGRTAIKRDAPELWQVSEHGNWRHVHCGALEALYGRTPFYRHYAPALTDVIADKALTSFADLCGALHEATARLTRPMAEAIIRHGELPGSARRRMAELAGADQNLPMAHHLFLLGPEAIFVILNSY